MLRLNSGTTQAISLVVKPDVTITFSLGLPVFSTHHFSAYISPRIVLSERKFRSEGRKTSRMFRNVHQPFGEKFIEF